MIGGGHFPIEAFVDVLDVPGIHVEVLDHLEVGNRYAAGVTKEIRDDVDALFKEDIIGFRGGRPVGQLGDYLGVDVAGVLLRDDVLDGRRDQDIDVQLEQLGVGHAFRAGQVADGAGLALAGGRFFRVDAVEVTDRPLAVADGDYFRPEHFLAEPGGVIAGVAVAVHGHGGFAEVDAERPGGLADGEHTAAGGSVAAARRSANSQRFTRDDTELRLAGDDGVFIHHPGHDLGGGIDVRGGDVFFRPDERINGADIRPA